MAYNLMYSGCTRDLNDNELRVEIYKDGAATAKEITLGGNSPITINYECDDVFKPLIQSSCSIKVVTDEPLLDLYTGKLNEIIVKVYKSNKLFWYGFLTPNVYTSDYGVGANEFTLEFIDCIAQLDNIKFKKDAFFKTFFSYLQDAVSKSDLSGVINYIVSQNIADGIDITDTGVLGRNFIDETDDEEDGAMTYKEVLESIMTYLHKSLIYWEDTLYMLSLPNIKNTTTFTRYNFKTGEKLTAAYNIDKTVRNIANENYLKTDIWANNGDATITLGNVYNKVTVIANTNEIDNVIPNVLDDDKLTKIMPDGVDYIEETVADWIAKSIRGKYGWISPPESGHTTLNAYFINGEWRNYPHPPIAINYDDIIEWVNPYPQGVSEGNIDYMTDGTFIQKYFDFLTDEGDPSSIDWKTCLSFVHKNGFVDPAYHPNAEPINYIELHTQNDFIGQGGYFILSMSYMFSNIAARANTCYRFTSEKYGEALPYSRTDTACNFTDDKFQVALRIGDYYYNGDEWVKGYSTFFIGHKNKEGDKIFGTTKKIDNNVSFRWGLADSQDGYAIKLPDDKPLHGQLTLTLWADARLGGAAQVPKSPTGIIGETGDATEYHKFDGDSVWNCSPIFSINVDSLKLIYTTEDSVKDVYNLEQYEPDIKYTNVIDDDYVTEMDDITLTTNTYNPHAVSYSYVLKQNGNDLVYIGATDGKIQEERIIDDYTNFYKTPKLQYSNSIDADKIKPWSRIKVRSLNKTMVNTNCEYDLQNNRANITLTEI